MRRRVQMAIRVLLGLFLVWFFLRDTDWKATYTAMRDVKIRWLLVSQVFAWSSYFARTQRWSYVVRAAHPASFRSLFSATQIGFLVNFTLPLRIGEVVRAYVLGRLTKLPFSQCVAMAGLDRVNDLLALLIVLFIAVVSLPSGQNIEIASGVFGNAEPLVVSGSVLRPAATSLTVVLLAALLVLIFLYLNQKLVLRVIGAWVGLISRRVAKRLQNLLLSFAAGMHIFGSATDLAKSIFFSLLTWGVSVVSLSAILTAFSIEFPWFTPVLMLAMIAVFISVPVTPGVVGQYHIAIVASMLLAIPGMEASQAKAVAIVAHLLSLIPIAALGIFCLVREGLSLTFLTRRAASRSLAESDDAGVRT